MAADDQQAFARAVVELRPKLHRYCARMMGSVIDGEDALQDALVKATTALATAGSIENMEGWLFRIAHNASLDLLRKHARSTEALDDEIEDLAATASDRLAATTALPTFMRLGAAQRSTVILMDVLGYSLDEIGRILDASVPAVKALLHRGRTRLRELAHEPSDVAIPALAPDERVRMSAYVDRFNAGDFAAVRDMLAEDVRLDLVAKTALKGKPEVQTYFHNYAGRDDWHFVPGFVEGRPAVLVVDPLDRDTVRYFVLLAWTPSGELAFIRDFRYARYVVDGAVISRSIE
jgi:RNA polymerase sigma-70 factor (ECF subfamily)